MLKTTALALLLAGASIGPTALGVPPQLRHEIVIDDDPGGRVDDHLRWWNRVKASGAHVRLHGMCMSACTFILILPHEQACVDQTASLGFHQASDGEGNALADETEALIRRYYPPVVQAWINKHRPLTLRIRFMSADEIVALGIFPACSDPSAAS